MSIRKRKDVQSGLLMAAFLAAPILGCQTIDVGEDFSFPEGVEQVTSAASVAESGGLIDGGAGPQPSAPGMPVTMVQSATAGSTDPRSPNWNVSTVPTSPGDEIFFYCRVQPLVINITRCATGGNCHTNESPRMQASAETTDTPPPCGPDEVLGPIPDSYRANYASSRTSIRPGNAAASSFLRRPMGSDHPVTVIFPGSLEEQIVTQWINGTP